MMNQENQNFRLSITGKYLGAIRGKLAADDAKDDSDAELERVLGPCVRGGFLVPAAKLLRASGYKLVEGVL